MHLINYCVWVPYDKKSLLGRTYIGHIHVLAQIDASKKLTARFPSAGIKWTFPSEKRTLPNMCHPFVHKSSWNDIVSNFPKHE